MCYGECVKDTHVCSACLYICESFTKITQVLCACNHMPCTFAPLAFLAHELSSQLSEADLSLLALPTGSCTSRFPAAGTGSILLHS